MLPQTLPLSTFHNVKHGGLTEFKILILKHGVNTIQVLTENADSNLEQIWENKIQIFPISRQYGGMEVSK